MTAPVFVMSEPACPEDCARQKDGCSFRVAWEINPHMRVGATCSRTARTEHRELVRVLREAGAIVHSVPFVHGAFDSVFTKDNALLVARGPSRMAALLARPRYDVRRIEQASRARALTRLGAEVSSPPDAAFEGGDAVVLPDAGGAFLGHGFRTAREAARELERFLDLSVMPLELRDPRLYHLDMALAVLDDGTALVCEEAFTSVALRGIERHPEVSDVVRVPLDEALCFGANLIQIGRTIVWAADAPRTSEALSRRGYHVVRTRLDQFHLAGGSAACLVSRVHAQLDAAPASTAA